jgi:predicted  nucleic acid-binding Zn-ribbon protein
MGTLGRRRGELDDEQLVVMEAIEELEAELGPLAAERAALMSEITAVRAALGTAEAEIDTELATIAIRRADATAAVPTALLDEYERLRARLDGVGAARLVNGTCDGCHLAASAAELDHIRHAPADEVVHCSQCGRILFA